MPKNSKEPQTPSAMTEAACRAVSMCASGMTGRDIAEALGVNEGTVSRWKQTTQFQAAVNEIHTEAKQAAISKMRDLASKAVDVLGEIMSDQSGAPADRLKAATLVLDRLGLDVVPTIGPTDPLEIERRQAIDKASSEFQSSWGF